MWDFLSDSGASAPRNTPKKTASYHLIKAVVDLVVNSEDTATSGAPAETFQASVLLNELNSIGMTLFTARHFSPGQRMYVRLEGTVPFETPAMVTWCRDLYPRSIIVGATQPTCRLGLKYQFESEQRRRMVEQACLEIYARHVAVREEAA
ncbi:MAG: hypothetical protein AB7P04_07700 [Bacteriovoracia bacterium]